MKILSLGAGVQSTTVLLMSCHGDLPKLDAAIFADTQWEPAEVYRHLDWLSNYAQKEGIPVHRVTAGDLREDYLKSIVGGRRNGGERWASMPVYTMTSNGKGMVRRQCTREYKIDPIRRKIRKLLGYSPRERIKDGTVEQWFGISIDEASRMRSPYAKWVRFYYPLVDLRMSRADCLQWLEKHEYPKPARSACIGCPFHSNREWRNLRDGNPDEWRDAVEFDHAIRKRGGIKGDTFLHRSCVPLDEADLGDPDERQGSLWNEECQGYCGN